LSDISFTIGILLEIQPIILVLILISKLGESRRVCSERLQWKNGRAVVEEQPMTCPEFAEGTVVPTWDCLAEKFVGGLL